MNILSCNIRFSPCQDGANDWIHRRDLCMAVIRSRSPDIICLQEVHGDQRRDVTAAFPAYHAFGMDKEPGTANPLNTILFRPELYRMISTGGYWLSDRPHVAGSKSWDSAGIRLANWIRFEERASGREFRVVNTHLDHIGQVARENQARLIAEDACAYPADYPQILTGDMNCDTGNRAIQVFRDAGWRDTYGPLHGTEDPGPTYHAFLGPRRPRTVGKMDWIFTRGTATAVAAEVIRDSDGERYPSDHYFIGATIGL